MSLQIKRENKNIYFQNKPNKDLKKNQQPSSLISDDFSCRYVSISSHSLSLSVHLCEVEILSSIDKELDRAQCGDDVDKGTVLVEGMCLASSKAGVSMSHMEAVNFCEERGLSLLHKQSNEYEKVYDVVK